ncbi:hypothetical protein B0J12DRAFT_695694 [Macrophomina phaseolina]|uniref:Uncharacterized protein n=1 Tax=Macrophomina phaseolina TaxID=35725 RepID=A0ABQ8GP52_9PEZI|nr:hypothetical protein B0J12DRAFT_695694 [Macrophomina phaseolina]
MQLPVCAYFILLALSAASFVVHQSDDLNDDIGGFRNYTGKFRAFGIPTRLSCDDQKVKVDGHCLEEATKRNIDIDPVAPRTRDYDILEHSPICKSMDFPLHQMPGPEGGESPQGSVLRNTSVQIYFGWDKSTKTAYHCANTNPQDNCAALFPDPDCDWEPL